MGQGFFLHYSINVFAYHGVLGSTDQIQILALYLVHHRIHFRKAHNSRNYAAADHERRYAVGEASVYHEVSCIRDHRAVQSCDVPHEVVEAVAGNLSCAVQVYAVKTFHDVGVVGYFKIGNNRLAEAFKLHVFGVVLSYRNGRVDNIGNDHHILGKLFGKLRFLGFKCRKAVGKLGNALFGSFGFVFFALSHKSAYFLGRLVAVGSQLVRLGLGGSQLRVYGDCLVHQLQFVILKFLFDILLYRVRIFADKFNIQHSATSFVLLKYYIIIPRLRKKINILQQFRFKNENKSFAKTHICKILDLILFIFCVKLL